MAEIKSIDVHKKDIELKLSISREEYKIIQNNTSDLIVLPCNAETLEHHLTTGKLGNSNRIMMPKKVLHLFKIKELDKKAPSTIFTIDNDCFLLSKIKKSCKGIPKFSDD
ncbi:MAG: hypothetical protein KAJ91_01250 [Candidatus Aenigmarchaeota archaeon]|nr:hypothetical protein [Candidatus Aenigmarchaeota archaeon]MCK5334107.1 hypothetical protein [Candidatus Aenigmarchaeota archaeon]